MPTSLDRPLAAALPWLVAFIVGAAAHVGIVREIENRPAVQAAPLVKVEFGATASPPVPTEAAYRAAAPTAMPATVFTIDPACTGGIEPRLAPELLFGIRQRSPTRFVLDRDVLDLLTEPSGYTGLRVIPSVHDGRTVGLVLFGMGECTPLQLMGLRNGDLLMRINGEPIPSAESPVADYRRLRAAPRIELDILRRGRPLSLVYQIE